MRIVISDVQERLLNGKKSLDQIGFELTSYPVRFYPSAFGDGSSIVCSEFVPGYAYYFVCLDDEGYPI